MCKWIQRSYSCGHPEYIASSWCSSYRRSQKKCALVVAFHECYPDRWCSACRRHTSADHRTYLRQLYADLVKRHPERNWDHIGYRAERPDRDCTPAPWQREDAQP